MSCNVIGLPNRPPRPVTSDDTAQAIGTATRIPHADSRLGRSAEGADPATCSYRALSPRTLRHPL